MTQALDLAEARELLDRLGFLLVPGPPFARGTAYLLVAVRPTPTLVHFDPERIEYWATIEGRGRPATIDWPTRAPESAEFSWGVIRLVDRLGVSNEFVAFGGTVETKRFEDERVVVFRSAAPIMSRGGHSQGWEAGSHDIHAYLARMRAAADPRAALERRMAGLSPVARYAAYVWDSLMLISATERLAGWTRADRQVLLRERRRLRDEYPEEWAAGVELACDLSGPQPGATVSAAADSGDRAVRH